MNYNAINKTLAEHAGWTEIRPSKMGSDMFGVPPCDEDEPNSRLEIPPYCGPDVNPILHFISRLNGDFENLAKFCHYVMDTCFDPAISFGEPKCFQNLSEFGVFKLMRFLTLHPEQIALAYLKAMNLYDPTLHE